jgi:hypothetical protein
MALPAMAVAQTPPPPTCMPQAQAGALVTFALPTLVQQLALRCREDLPPTAYLIANAGALADRYRPGAAAAWPMARRAIGQIFTQFLGQPMPDDMNSDLIRVLAEPALAGLLAKRVQRQDCATASAAIADTAALSGRAIGRLVALAVTVADKKGNGIAGVLKVCKPEEDR